MNASLSIQPKLIVDFSKREKIRRLSLSQLTNRSMMFRRRKAVHGLDRLFGNLGEAEVGLGTGFLVESGHILPDGASARHLTLTVFESGYYSKSTSFL